MTLSVADKLKDVREVKENYLDLPKSHIFLKKYSFMIQQSDKSYNVQVPKSKKHWPAIMKHLIQDIIYLLMQNQRHEREWEAHYKAHNKMVVELKTLIKDKQDYEQTILELDGIIERYETDANDIDD